MNRFVFKTVLGSIAVSLVVPLATILITGGIMSIPPNTRGIDVAAGQKLFSVHCGSCHFADLGPPAHHGPNLHEIGRTGALRRPNQTAAKYILESILDPRAFVAPSGRPGMPLNTAVELSPEEMRNLIGFVASRGAIPDYEEIRNLQIPDRRSAETQPMLIRRKDMELAENVLRQKGNCLNCHSLFKSPEGSTFAPGIFGLGLTDQQAVHESLVAPDKEIQSQYESVKVMLVNGEFLLGKIVSLTDDQLVLCLRDEQNQLVLRNIPLAEVEKENDQPLIKASRTSLMPTGFDKSLTEEEIDAVINLIRQLN